VSWKRRAYKKARKKYFGEKTERKRKSKAKRKTMRMTPEKRAFNVRAGWHNRHHIHPKARGGNWSTDNILYMDERRHAAFHLLFGLKTFTEADELLLRAHRAKKGEDHMSMIQNHQCPDCTKWCPAVPIPQGIALKRDYRENILNLSGNFIKCVENNDIYFVKDVQAQCPN
jgi:hypothetical protein